MLSDNKTIKEIILIKHQLYSTVC